MLARSSEILRVRSSRTIRAATRIALAAPRSVALPWLFTTSPLRPRKTAPLWLLGSRWWRSSSVAGREIRNPIFERTEEVTARRRRSVTKHAGERRAVDSGHGAERELGHGHQRPGIAAGDAGMGLALLHRGDRTAHGGRLGAADRLARLVVAGDDVGAVDDVGDRGERRAVRELAANRRLVAEQQEGKVVAALMGERGAGDHHRGAGIATHRVDCDPRRA